MIVGDTPRCLRIDDLRGVKGRVTTWVQGWVDDRSNRLLGAMKGILMVVNRRVICIVCTGRCDPKYWTCRNCHRVMIQEALRESIREAVEESGGTDLVTARTIPVQNWT